VNYVLFVKKRIVVFLALFTAAVLILGWVADCERDPGPYNPSPGDTIWR